MIPFHIALPGIELHTSCSVPASVLPDLDGAKHLAEHAEEQCPVKVAGHVGATCEGSPSKPAAVFVREFPLHRRSLIGMAEPSLYLGVFENRQGRAHETDLNGLRGAGGMTLEGQSLKVSLDRGCISGCASVGALDFFCQSRDDVICSSMRIAIHQSPG
jgi:hypothetical protein